MEVQVTRLLESPTAQWARKRLDISVRPHMLAEVHGLRETLGADHAFERLYLGVGAQMLIQAGLLRKSLRAVGAPEGANSRVHSHMLL